MVDYPQPNFPSERPDGRAGGQEGRPRKLKLDIQQPSSVNPEPLGQEGFLPPHHPQPGSLSYSSPSHPISSNVPFPPLPSTSLLPLLSSTPLQRGRERSHEFRVGRERERERGERGDSNTRWWWWSRPLQHRLEGNHHPPRNWKREGKKRKDRCRLECGTLADTIKRQRNEEVEIRKGEGG
ncbi:hypothetical protein IE53DRAFT_111562 [Violaceomyces palustris]|uniref:Uncharacterized protein n=1 Tax=Violaceomyces palustris TaxID=1673888 RepID=A0ACD0NW90_9BASI|nr:hypothetical protein IE53DRAFT_111562 [Violaceomyces palustris]